MTTGPPNTFVKRNPAAPAGFFEVEAAGLRWLAAAETAGGTPVVPVVRVGTGWIELGRLTGTAPTPRAAERFGRQLAATHAAGARWHGCPPDGWSADGFIGPAAMPHDRTGPGGSWGECYAALRVQPFLRAALDARVLDSQDAALIDRVCERLVGDDEELVGAPEPPSRLHGDLWSGNVLWTAAGATLIDPAAHGGHRESDLAMLALFGFPYLERVLAAYHEARPLADGWRERVPLHQLHPLLVHAVLFGGGYGKQAAAAAAQYV